MDAGSAGSVRARLHWNADQDVCLSVFVLEYHWLLERPRAARCSAGSSVQQQDRCLRRPLPVKLTSWSEPFHLGF